MKFGPINVAECEGAILAHALNLPHGRLKKGHLLSKVDVNAAAKAEHETLIVAQLESGDVIENEAASKLADAVFAGNTGLRMEAPFTGRVNFYAAHDGLFGVERVGVDAVNKVHSSMTLATLSDSSLVEAGRMVATVKIIPLAVEGDSLNKAIAVAKTELKMRVLLPKIKRVFLVQTVLDTIKSSVLDKTRRHLETRLEFGDVALAHEMRVEHNQDALQKALQTITEENSFDGESDIIVIFGASAITDFADVIPAVVKELSGEVIHLGMPVDPGNLLMMAQLKGAHVIGAPGCARSPAENGFDWVLQRLIYGAAGDADWITTQGVGGLLMEIHDRPHPREGGA